MIDKKKEIVEEKIFWGRMVKDFKLYTAKEVHELSLGKEEFVTEDNKYALTYVHPYERKGRRDKNSDGNDKPRVKVSSFFKRKISLEDYHELYGKDHELLSVGHKVHYAESEWHATWKERVKDFCKIEKRFYPDGKYQRDGYTIADAYYEETNTVIEFQKSFDDEALKKTDVYKKQNVRLIWLFYLPILEVYEVNDVYNLREDNFFHFFRITDSTPDFYENNIVFVQDKNDKIYLVNDLKRVEANSELQATVRYFDKDLFFETPNDFVDWLKKDWKNSEYYRKNKVIDDVSTLQVILETFNDTDVKKVYLQDISKPDKYGRPLIYCFYKEKSKFIMDKDGRYGSIICKIVNNWYEPNWLADEFYHNPNNKKWRLLTTNLKKYRSHIEFKK